MREESPQSILGKLRPHLLKTVLTFFDDVQHSHGVNVSGQTLCKVLQSHFVHCKRQRFRRYASVCPTVPIQIETTCYRNLFCWTAESRRPSPCARRCWCFPSSACCSSLKHRKEEHQRTTQGCVYARTWGRSTCPSEVWTPTQPRLENHIWVYARARRSRLHPGPAHLRHMCIRHPCRVAAAVQMSSLDGRTSHRPFLQDNTLGKWTWAHLSSPGTWNLW